MKIRLEDVIGDEIDHPGVICPRIKVRLVAVDRKKRIVTIEYHGRDEELPIEMFIGRSEP